MAEIIVSKPKRKRGAQPGNFNASRNPWRNFWRKRALKEADKWLVPFIEEYLDGLLGDRGGADNVTAAERHVVEICQTARGASMLILKECSERGFIVMTDNGWDLAPGAKDLGRFLSLELNALRAIGMDKRAPKEVTLEDYLEQRYGNRDDGDDSPTPADSNTEEDNQ